MLPGRSENAQDTSYALIDNRLVVRLKGWHTISISLSTTFGVFMRDPIVGPH